MRASYDNSLYSDSYKKAQTYQLGILSRLYNCMDVNDCLQTAALLLTDSSITNSIFLALFFLTSRRALLQQFFQVLDIGLSFHRTITGTGNNLPISIKQQNSWIALNRIFFQQL